MLAKVLCIGLLSISVALFLGGCRGAPLASEEGHDHTAHEHSMEPAAAEGHEGHDHGAHDAAEGGEEPAMLICPVTGEMIPDGQGYAYEYQGQKVIFCCDDCVAPFEKNPEKYLE